MKTRSTILTRALALSLLLWGFNAMPALSADTPGHDPAKMGVNLQSLRS